MRHFTDISSKEIAKLVEVLETAAIKWSEQVGMSGLSQLGSHDIYSAIEDAMYREWQAAKKKRIERSLKRKWAA